MPASDKQLVVKMGDLSFQVINENKLINTHTYNMLDTPLKARHISKDRTPAFGNVKTENDVTRDNEEAQGQK